MWHLTATVCTTFSTLSVTDTNHLFHFSTVHTNVFYSECDFLYSSFLWLFVVGGKVFDNFVNLGMTHSYQLRRYQEDLKYTTSLKGGVLSIEVDGDFGNGKF